MWRRMRCGRVVSGQCGLNLLEDTHLARAWIEEICETYQESWSLAGFEVLSPQCESLRVTARSLRS
jgi:hypothetical protein